MAKKEVRFEGVIDGSYSQILVDPETDKWFLLGQVKSGELKRVQANLEKINQGRMDEDKVQLEVKRLNGKRSAFLFGEISKESALKDIEQNKQNQNRGKSRIKDVKTNSEKFYLSDIPKKFRNAKDKFIQNLGKNAPANIVAGALCVAMVAASVLAACQPNSQQGEPDFSTPAAQVSTFEPEEEIPEVVYQRVDLEDVDLKENAYGSFTSDSVKQLSKAIVDELDELYQMSEFELPDIVNVETLSSLFFFENTCRAVDSKDDAYVGIAQVGKEAVKAAIERADRKYSKLQEDATFFGEDNYIIDNICSKGQNVDALTNILWEKAKTDPKLCGMLAALCLADLSDRNTTKLQQNAAAIITMYNAGEGNFAKFENLGIITLSEDKQRLTIDLSKVDNIKDVELREKWNESVNYLIRVAGGRQLLTANPRADVLTVCEEFRVKVGDKDEIGEKPNLKQYNYAPNGVEFIGLNLEQGFQPGQ